MKPEVIATASADRLQPLLAKRGIRTFAFQTVIQVPPEDPAPILKAVAGLADFDWLIFTSKSAVKALASRCESGVIPEGPRIACVGKATATAAIGHGASVDLVPTDTSGAGLARALLPRLAKTSRILWPRAAEALRDLSQLLEEAGHQVDAPIAYRTQAPPESPDLYIRRRQLLDGFRDGRFCAMTFLSPSAVKNLAGLIGTERTHSLLSTIIIAAIGKTTAAHPARDYRTPDIIPKTPSIEGLASPPAKQVTAPECPSHPPARDGRS